MSISSSYAVLVLSLAHTGDLCLAFFCKSADLSSFFSISVSWRWRQCNPLLASELCWGRLGSVRGQSDIPVPRPRCSVVHTVYRRHQLSRYTPSESHTLAQETLSAQNTKFASTQWEISLLDPARYTQQARCQLRIGRSPLHTDVASQVVCSIVSVMVAPIAAPVLLALGPAGPIAGKFNGSALRFVRR